MSEQYKTGTPGSNDCPTGYVNILEESECQTAAEAAGFKSDGTTPVHPFNHENNDNRDDRSIGCFMWTNGDYFFNTKTEASSPEKINDGSSPVCRLSAVTFADPIDNKVIDTEGSLDGRRTFRGRVRDFDQCQRLCADDPTCVGVDAVPIDDSDDSDDWDCWTGQFASCDIGGGGIGCGIGLLKEAPTYTKYKAALVETRTGTRICLSVCLSVRPYVCLSVCPSVRPSVCLPVCYCG